MKITINNKKLEGTPKEVIKFIEDNLSEKDQEKFIDELKNNKDYDMSNVSEKDIEELLEGLDLNENISVKDMLSVFKKERPEDNFKKTEDGKIEIPMNMKKSTERKLQSVMKNENKTVDEVAEQAITEEIDRFDNINFTEIEGIYEMLNIPVNDRLKNFQVMKILLNNGYENCLNDLKIGNDQQKKFAKDQHLTFVHYINPVLKAMKLFELDDEVVPMLSLQDFDEQKSPFPSIGVDCQAWLERDGVKRFYFGFLIGSYYTEDNVHYRAVTTIYAEEKPNGEYGLDKDLFILEKEKCKELTGTTGEKVYGELRRFIYAFLNYINSPEVIIKDMPHNPKNDERREKKGKVVLPPSSKVQIHGTILRKYVDDVNEGVRTFGYSCRFWVRGHYEHFWNRKRYHHVYNLDKADLKKLGYDVKPDGTIRKFKKSYIKGQGLLIEKEYQVKK